MEYKRILTTHSPTEIITSLILMDRDRYAITSSTDESIRITNLVTEENRLSIPKTHDGGANCLLLTAGGLIASGGKDGSLKLFDTVIGRNKGVLLGHKGPIYSIVQPDLLMNYVITCSDDKTLIFWTLDHLQALKTVHSPSGRPIRALIKVPTFLLSQDNTSKEYKSTIYKAENFGGQIITGNKKSSHILFADHKIHLYNLNSSQIERSFAAHTGNVRCLQIFQNYLLSSAEDHTLKIWDFFSGDNLTTVRTKESHVMRIFEGEFLVTGGIDFGIKFYDLG